MKTETKKKYMAEASSIQFEAHSLPSAMAMANIHAYLLELILKHYDNESARARIDALADDVRTVQKDLNWLYSLKHENEAIKLVAYKLLEENKQLKAKIEKINQYVID